MSKRTEEKLNDFYKWFLEHEKDVKSETTGIYKKIKFLYRMIYNLAWVQTYLIEDIQALEGRQIREEGEQIWKPSTLKLDQDLREGGDQRP